MWPVYFHIHILAMHFLICVWLWNLQSTDLKYHMQMTFSVSYSLYHGNYYVNKFCVDSRELVAGKKTSKWIGWELFLKVVFIMYTIGGLRRTCRLSWHVCFSKYSYCHIVGSREIHFYWGLFSWCDHGLFAAFFSNTHSFTTILRELKLD